MISTFNQSHHYKDLGQLGSSWYNNIIYVALLGKHTAKEYAPYVLSPSPSVQAQGALFVAAFFEIILGFGGIISILLRFIGPLTIAPTIALIGLSLTGLTMQKCSSHWGISIL